MDIYISYKMEKDLDNIRKKFNLKNNTIKNKIHNNDNSDNSDKKRCKCCRICGQNEYWCICEIIMTG